MLDTLLNGSSGARQEIHLSSQALIQGDFKLVVGEQAMTAWTGPYYPNTTGKCVWAGWRDGHSELCLPAGHCAARGAVTTLAVLHAVL